MCFLWLIQLIYWATGPTAYDLSKEQRLNFGDDITTALRMAKKQKWAGLEEKRIQQEIELQTYINKLIVDDKNRYDIDLTR